MANTNPRIALHLAILFILCLLPGPLRADIAPKEIAGIVLGSQVDAYPDIVRSNFLSDVVITDWHGFRKGVISYGTCRYNGQILKMDMKYEDSSREFYKTVLDKLREKYGEPTSWNGDSFGVMLIWKWQFVDSEQNRISLTLQHNGKNSNETIGNMLKLSLPEKIEEERICFSDMCAKHKEKVDASRLLELKKTDWSYLIPR